MINRTVLVGRITKDPEIKYTTSNIAMCKFTLAVNRTFKKDGETDVDFIQCIAWRNAAEFMGNYVKKGGLLGIEGRIQTGSYDNKDGVRVYTTDIMCDSVQSLESKQDKQGTHEPHIEVVQERPTIDVDSDDLPF